jgi:hypothetical protein
VVWGTPRANRASVLKAGDFSFQSHAHVSHNTHTVFFLSFSLSLSLTHSLTLSHTHPHSLSVALSHVSYRRLLIMPLAVGLFDDIAAWGRASRTRTW